MGDAMKTCVECQEIKLFDAFYKNPSMADGYFGRCKICYNKKQAAYVAENLEKVRARRRFIAKTSEASRLTHLKSAKNYRAKHIHKNRTRNRTLRAIKAGLIVKTPCEKCGNLNVECHHLDYSDHMSVMFLCREHHAEWHKVHGYF